MAPPEPLTLVTVRGLPKREKTGFCFRGGREAEEIVVKDNVLGCLGRQGRRRPLFFPTLLHSPHSLARSLALLPHSAALAAPAPAGALFCRCCRCSCLRRLPLLLLLLLLLLLRPLPPRPPSRYIKRKKHRPSRRFTRSSRGWRRSPGTPVRLRRGSRPKMAAGAPPCSRRRASLAR